MDNASIHHVDGVTDLIETHANARLCFLPPHSPASRGSILQSENNNKRKYLPLSHDFKGNGNHGTHNRRLSSFHTVATFENT